LPEAADRFNAAKGLLAALAKSWETETSGQLRCHPERSEGSALLSGKQIPRYARDDKKARVGAASRRELFALALRLPRQELAPGRRSHLRVQVLPMTSLTFARGGEPIQCG